MCEADFTGIDAGEYYAMRDFEARERSGSRESELNNRIREQRKQIKELSEALEKCKKQIKEDRDLIFAQQEKLIEIVPFKWISVEERLPKREEYVLVRYQNNDMIVACVFDRDECMTFWRAQTDEGWCCDCDTEPTHWMPLPEPPKEET